MNGREYTEASTAKERGKVKDIKLVRLGTTICELFSTIIGVDSLENVEETPSFIVEVFELM